MGSIRIAGRFMVFVTVLSMAAGAGSLAFADETPVVAAGSPAPGTSFLPSYKTSGQQTFFSFRTRTGEPDKDFSTDNNVLADGNRTRISPQAYYYWRPFGLLGEYVRTSQEVRRSNDVARYSELRVDGDAFPKFADPAKSANRAKAWAAGFNWYLNPKVKIQADYERTRFTGGASGNQDREQEKVILSRVEVAYWAAPAGPSGTE